LPSGELVVLTDEDFADLPLPTTKTVDVHEFVPLEQVDPIYFAKTYYLEPEKGGVKPVCSPASSVERQRHGCVGEGRDPFA
jgi:DNA end-binding protein Ku